MVVPKEVWNENTPSLIDSPNCVLHRTNLLMMLWNYARSLVIENDAACPWTNLPFGKSNESLPHIPKHSLSSLNLSFQFLQDWNRLDQKRQDRTKHGKAWPNTIKKGWTRPETTRHNQTHGTKLYRTEQTGSDRLDLADRTGQDRQDQTVPEKTKQHQIEPCKQSSMKLCFHF